MNDGSLVRLVSGPHPEEYVVGTGHVVHRWVVVPVGASVGADYYLNYHDGEVWWTPF